LATRSPARFVHFPFSHAGAGSFTPSSSDFTQARAHRLRGKRTVYLQYHQRRTLQKCKTWASLHRPKGLPFLERTCGWCGSNTFSPFCKVVASAER
jgi:hypothetical protein